MTVTFKVTVTFFDRRKVFSKQRQVTARKEACFRVGEAWNVD